MAIDCLALYLQSLRLRGGRCLLTTRFEEYDAWGHVFLLPCVEASRLVRHVGMNTVYRQAFSCDTFQAHTQHKHTSDRLLLTFDNYAFSEGQSTACNNAIIHSLICDKPALWLQDKALN